MEIMRDLYGLDFFNVFDKINFLGKHGGEKKVKILMKEIIEKIQEEIKKHPTLNQEKIAKIMDISPGGLSTIFSKERLRVADFVKIAEILQIEPSEFFPKTEPVDLEKMSLVDLIKNLVRAEIENYLMPQEKPLKT